MIKRSLRVVLWPRANKDGLYPIYIRVTVSGKQSYISTGYACTKDQWDDKAQQVRLSHPSAVIWNIDTQDQVNKINRKMVELQIAEKTFTARSIRQMFSGRDLTNIFEFLDAFTDEVKNKREAGTLENYRKHLLRLELFHGSRSLSFEEITPEYLARYENNLRTREGKGRKKAVGENYTHALFKTLRTLFNAARKKKLITCYPFTDYENPVYVSPVKDYLTPGELQEWEKYTDQVADPVKKQAATYFLLGCYSGLRVSDWLQFDREKNIVGDMLHLRAKKNKEWVEMPISIPLRRTLDRMALLPLTIEEPTINEKLKAIATACGIKGKRITTHTGRHTFAVTVCLGNKISSETAAELMGITLATFVGNYSQVTQDKINREAREAWKGLK